MGGKNLFCLNCGEEVTEYKFCHACGTKTEISENIEENKDNEPKSITELTRTVDKGKELTGPVQGEGYEPDEDLTYYFNDKPYTGPLSLFVLL